MTKVEHALALAAKGFHVFPLVPFGKFPIQEDFPNRATRDPVRIRQLWNAEEGSNPLFHADFNIGIYTGRFGDQREDGTYEHLVAIDVDNKDGKNGSATLNELREKGLVTPHTYVQTTPSGGLHYVYRTDAAVSNSVGSSSAGLGVGLDIRGVGGFLCAAGSTVAAGSYGAHDLPVAFADDSLIERCARHVPRAERAVLPAGAIDETAAAQRMREYLTYVSPAIEGSGGNNHTFIVAARCKDLGLNPDTTLAIMLEDDGWNSRCSPPWEPYELQRLVDNAFQFGRNAQGSAAPEAAFTAVAAPVEEGKEPEPDYAHPVNALNRDHALLFIGGDHYVLWETKDAEGQLDVRHLSEQAFLRLHAGKTHLVPKKTPKGGEVLTPEPITKLWLGAQSKPSATGIWRRTYRGVWYAPGKDAPDGYYNAWRGFTCEPHPKDSPVPADWQWALDAWKEHVLKNICNGDETHAHWLTGWLAHLVQKPYEKPLTAIVVHGEKGTGKTSTFERIADLFGRHAIVAHDKRFLFSQFNGHFESLGLLVLDEAMWAGDKEGESKLKGLITGSKHNIERKGKEIYPVPNLTRIVMTGNNEWQTPASHEERRFAVFTIGLGRQKDKVFFERQKDIMRAGGSALLLRYLLDFDLSTVDVNEAPNTTGLARQKLLSLEGIEQWWYTSLVDGVLCGQAGSSTEWPTSVLKSTMRDLVRTHYRNQGLRYPPADVEMLTMLNKIGAGIVAARGSRGSDPMNKDAQPHLYRLPDLETARAKWDARMGYKEKWA